MAAEGEEGPLAYAGDQVDQLLRCPICLDRYNQPKILPCQHTFCLSPCLQGLVDMRSRSVRCPECRMEHYVPAQGAHGFPTNRIVANFLELHPQAVAAPPPRQTEPLPQAEETPPPQTEDPNKCGICEKQAETSRCVHCNKLACQSCKKTHFNQMKFDVGRLVSQIRRGIPKISNAVAAVEHKSEQVKQQVEGVKSEVRDTIERYIKELRDREKMICSELDTFLQGEQRNLRLHQENLEVEIASISSYCESTESRINRVESDMTEEDLVNMKHQCSEYMNQLGIVETDAVPETRPISFSFSGNQLHSSIINFGEVVSPTPRPSPATTASNTSNTTTTVTQATTTTNTATRVTSVPATRTMPSVTPTTTSQTARTTEARRPPAGPSRYNDLLDRGEINTYTSSSLSPYRPLSPPHFRTRSPLFRSASDASVMDPYVTSPRTMEALRGGYMFQMDTDTSRVLSEMDLIWQADPSPRRRQNHSSLFGRDNIDWENRPAGFVGGGGSTADAIATPMRVRDSRPAISFSVGLSEDGTMRTRGRPPRRLRPRGTDSRNRGGNQTASTQPQSQSQPQTNGTARGETRGTSRSRRGRGRGQQERGPQSDPQPGPSTEPQPSTSTEPQPGPSGERPNLGDRRNTFIMEEEEEENELNRPHVDDHDDDDDVIVGESNGSNSTSNTQLVHNETRVAVRPINNYQRKGVMKKMIGGERGNSTGQFNWPRGITVSPSNDSIVVADSSNHRVQIFDCNGAYVTTFGSYGSGPGEFDCLAGVAVNTNGQIIIADRYNHRVQIFDRYGTFQKQFGREGSGKGQMSYPWGVAVDYLGNIYVCDKENHRLQVFKPDGKFIRKIGSLGSRDGQMENPHYVTVSHDGKIIVSDTSNHRIQVFTSDGKHVKSIGTEGSGQGQLKLPKGVAVDRQGFILVADSGNDRVQVFYPDGRYYSSFGEHGTGNGQFKGLEGLALTSDGKVIISDKENHRVQIF